MIRERLLSEYVPWRDYWDRDVVSLPGGAVFMMAELDGLPFETTSDAVLLQRHAQLEHAMRDAAEDGLIYHFLQCRGVADAAIYPRGELQTEFSRALDRQYRDKLFGARLMWLNRTYLAIQVSPYVVGGRTVQKWLPDLRRKNADPPKARIDRLRNIASIFFGQLKDYRPRILGIEWRDGMPFSQIAEAVAFAMTGYWREVPLSLSGAAAVFSETFIIGHDAFEIRMPHRNAFGVCLNMHDYPSATKRTGMLDRFLTSSYRHTLFHAFRCMPSLDGTEMLTRKQNTMRQAGDKALEQAAELTAAANLVAGGRMIMGEHGFACTLFCDDLEALPNVVQSGWGDLSSGGIKVERESISLEAVLFSMIPGNFRLRGREAAISSRNFAAFALMRNFSGGERKGFWGNPICMFRTSGGSPFLFHFHAAASGNMLVTGKTRSGKAQPLDAKVLTPTGFRQMGDIKVGDLVTCPDGKVAPVIGVFQQGEKEIYRVTFEDGRQVECCDDHLWKVWEHAVTFETGKSHETRKVLSRAHWRVLPLREIRRWFDSGLRKRKRAAVPLVSSEAIELPAQEVPIPPYVIGALLGNGTLSDDNPSSLIFTTADQAIIDRLHAELPEYKCRAVSDVAGIDYRLVLRDRRKYRIAKLRIKPDVPEGRLAYRGIEGAMGGVVTRTPRTLSPLGSALNDLGLVGMKSHEKFIPDTYKRGSVAQRIALLQGLMDTDGSVGNGTHATFSSASERLAKDVQEIAWSLGAIASIECRQTDSTHKDQRRAGRQSWRVSIVHPNVSMMFSLPRKVAQCKQKTMQHRLRIVGIESIGVKPAQCIAVDHPDNLYVTDNYVVTHNTTLLGWMISQSERANVQVVLWDKDNGLEAFVRACEGNYLSLINSPGHGSGLAPLKRLTDDPEDMRFLSNLIRACISTPREYEFTPEEDRRLGIALRHVMRLPPEQRCLGEIRAFLGSNRSGAGARLEKWCWGQEYGWVIDGPRDVVDLSNRLNAFDQSAVLNDPIAAGAIMAVLFHYTGKLADGRRLLLVLDEVWNALRIPQFHATIRNGLATYGKYNVPIIIGTQSPRDALGSPIAHVIREQCSQIHFGNPGAVWTDYGPDGLNRSEKEFEIVRSLPLGTGHFLLVQEDRSNVLQLPLAGFSQVKVISGTRTGLDALALARKRTDDASGPALVDAYHEALEEMAQ